MSMAKFCSSKKWVFVGRITLFWIKVAIGLLSLPWWQSSIWWPWMSLNSGFYIMFDPSRMGPIPRWLVKFLLEPVLRGVKFNRCMLDLLVADKVAASIPLFLECCTGIVDVLEQAIIQLPSTTIIVVCVVDKGGGNPTWKVKLGGVGVDYGVVFCRFLDYWPLSSFSSGPLPSTTQWWNLTKMMVSLVSRRMYVTPPKFVSVVNWHVGYYI